MHNIVSDDTDLSYLDDVFTKLTEQLQKDVDALQLPPPVYNWERALQDDTGAFRRKSERGATPPSPTALLIGIAGQRDFLIAEQRGLCRLSAETRIREEKRLGKQYARDKGKRAYKKDGRRKGHWAKEQSRKASNAKRWTDDPLTRMKYSFNKPVHITPEQWERCIAPEWNKYDRKYLKVRCSDKAAYTLYNTTIYYHPPREKYSRQQPKPFVIYDGHTQAVHDAVLGIYSMA